MVKAKSKLVKRICETCGKDFLVKPSVIKRGYGKFCSQECYGKWYSKHYRGENSATWKGGKIQHICQICGKELLITPSSIKKGRGKFCSKECQGKFQSKHRGGKNNSHWKGGKVKRICPTCEKEFEVKPSKIKQGEGKFCSRECFFQWRSEFIRGQAHPNWKPKIKKTCQTCGKKFLIQSAWVKRGSGKFCSLKCMGKWMSKNLRGKNSPNWKNGASFEPYCQKFNNEFKEYIRDKFGRLCFLCSKTEEENGKRLSVHHVNYNKSCGCDDDETCQFVPLCVSCNSKVNKNREMWEKKIKDKMQNKLNGWYI